MKQQITHNQLNTTTNISPVSSFDGALILSNDYEWVKNQ